MQKNTFARAAMLVSVSSLAVAALPAVAQEAQAEVSSSAENNAEVDEAAAPIVVTGSRIQQRADYNTPNPVVAVTAETL